LPEGLTLNSIAALQFSGPCQRAGTPLCAPV
jgi:hypothetical protein